MVHSTCYSLFKKFVFRKMIDLKSEVPREKLNICRINTIVKSRKIGEWYKDQRSLSNTRWSIKINEP